MTNNIDQILKEATKRPKRKMQDYELEQAYGAEPVWIDVKNTDEDFRTKISNALNWANGVLEKDQYKEEVFAYLIANNKPTDVLEHLAPWKFMEAGKLAWLHNNGCPLNAILMERLVAKTELLYTIKDETDDVILDESGEIIVDEVKIKVSRAATKARLAQNKVSDLIALIEDIIDQAVVAGVEINESVIYHKLTSDKVEEKLTSEMYDKLIKKHRLLEKEFESVQKIDEAQQIVEFDTVENFQNYLGNIEANIDGYVNAVNQLSSYMGNKKALKKSERKVGKHQAKKIETQISKMNFKVQDENYKVISITPSAIVGALTLVAFNTHTRKISIYVANDETGLSVKGTTLQNFDEKASVQKILKKPDMLKQFQEGNVRRLKVLFKDNIRAKEGPVNGRMNEHTILLKVYKEKYTAE